MRAVASGIATPSSSSNVVTQVGLAKEDRFSHEADVQRCEYGRVCFALIAARGTQTESVAAQECCTGMYMLSCVLSTK